MDFEEKSVIEAEFEKAVKSNTKLWEWATRLDGGLGTYKDVQKFAELIGDEIAKTITEEYSEEVLMVICEKAHELINNAAELAQYNLSNAGGLGIKAKSTKFPKARFEDVTMKLVNATDVVAAARVVVPTFTLEMADKIIKYNMDFQAKAGLKPIVRRTWSGEKPTHDPNHWDDCEKLAGEWEYGKEPRLTWARHEGCRCTVEFFPSRKAESKIASLSAGEADNTGVMWNTQPETLDKRMKQAEIRRAAYKAKQAAGRRKG